MATATFEAAPFNDITDSINAVRATFQTQKTKCLQFRIRQLRRLFWAVHDNTPLIEEALAKDMGKCQFEAHISEIDWIKNEAIYVARNVEKWAKDERYIDYPAHYRPFKHRLRNEPLGVILVVGAFNFPFQVTLAPLIGAIAAGNCAVLKTSELSPNSAIVVKKIVEQLDPDCFVCINGGPAEAKHIMEHKFDKIVFTGGQATGTIIAKKAAETLTPYILELGGKNPAIVTKNANIQLAAKRIFWQKTLNAGQACLAHNYVLIERPVLNDFITEINKQLEKSMPNGADMSPDWSRIINSSHFNRLKTMLSTTKGKIVMGGGIWESKLTIEPTAVLVDDIQDSMMVQESFGPIWALLPYDTLDEAIYLANQVDSTPLALSTFGSESENKKVLNSVTSGGATCNDGFMHCILNQTPLGGVGTSGQGSYHGYFSFKAFSHQRAIACVPSWADFLVKVRYMPYNRKALMRLQNAVSLKPDFDRNGDNCRGFVYWIKFVAALTAKSAKTVVLRCWLAIVTYLWLKRGPQRSDFVKTLLLNGLYLPLGIFMNLKARITGLDQ